MQLRLVFVALTLAPVLAAQSYTINTFAGGGLPPLPAPALSISIGSSFGVVADNFGNFYVADTVLNVVYKVDPSGMMTVVAGTGRQGYSGDGGPATSAQLTNPVGLALDAVGNLYIADSGNARIRKVSTSGAITTIAGNGACGYDGDGGLAVLATLCQPYGVAIDGDGDIFTADVFNNVVREVSSSGTITTFAGNHTQGYSGDGGPATQAALNGPYSVTVDASGNVYVADTGNFRIRKVSGGGIISTYAGSGDDYYSGDGGPAVSADIGDIFDIAVDSAGNLYMADGQWNRVREVSPAGIITTFAGNGDYGSSGDGGPASDAELSIPEGVAAGPNGTLYILDSGDFHVRQVSSSQIIATVAGNGSENYSGDNGPALSALLGRPIGVAVAGDGTVYVSDSGNDRVRRVSTSGSIVTVAGNGIEGYSGDDGPATEVELTNPQGVAVDGQGNVYFADSGNFVIVKVTAAGALTTIAGDRRGPGPGNENGGPAILASFTDPTGIAVDGSGNVYISDLIQNVVRTVSPEGIIETLAGGEYSLPVPERASRSCRG